MACRKHLARLLDLLGSGSLQPGLDPRRFLGLDEVAEAVEYLQSGASCGKVVVQLLQDEQLPPRSTLSRL
jgi:threonine dehydrogenase-like Zn-dependent dehydrogenase